MVKCILKKSNQIENFLPDFKFFTLKTEKKIMGKRKLKGADDNLNQDFCDFLYELAEYEKNVSKNIYKYNAYRRAAETLAKHPKRITSGDEAKKLPGIGEKIGKKIDEFLATGKVKKLEEIKSDDKNQIINLLTKVSGIGPAKAQELVEAGVRSIDDLNSHLDKLTHHQKIGLKYFKDLELRIPRQEIENVEKVLKSEIKKVDENFIVTICGSYRRGKTSSGDIDCLLTHPRYLSNGKGKFKHKQLLKDVILQLEKCNLIVDTMAMGDTKYMGICRLSRDKPGRRLDIRLTPHDQYYCSILYFTGSDLFNRTMRKHALERGFTLNEYSLRPVGINGVLGEPVLISSEREIFDCIDFPYKEPNERDV